MEEFTRQTYPGGSTPELKSPFASKLSDQLSPMLDQVHNRSFDPLWLSESTTTLPWTQETESELNAFDQGAYDSMSAVPSLISSGMSSVQTNFEGCITPGLSTTKSPVPFIKSCNGSVSEDSHLIFPKWPRVAESDRDSVDWTQWHPAKFECAFCKERFLLDSQLRSHLRTHKRYRRYLRTKPKNNHLGLSSCPNLDISSQPPPHKSLANRPRQTVGEHPKVSSLTDEVSLTGIKYHRNTVHNTSTCQRLLTINTLPKSDGEEVQLTVTSSTNTTTSESNILDPHLPHDSKLCEDIKNCQKATSLILNSGSYCVKDRNCSGGREIEDSSDTRTFTVDMDVTEHHGDHWALSGMNSYLHSKKQDLLARIMDEFLIIWKQDWTSNIRRCGTTPKSRSNATTPSKSENASQAAMTNKGQQQGTGDENNEAPGDGDGDDDDDQRAPKRPRTSPSPVGILQDNSKFACPYRKYNPRKYCVQKWRPCALTPLDSVARVKAHLYRHHRIYQCQRCKQLFMNQGVLDEHILALEGCEPNRVNLAEGITTDIEKKLRSRKKTHRHQTEAERWTEIYQTLFPGAVLPNPFFEPVEEDVEPSPDSQKLADFEEYTRRELPQMFWTALEQVVTKELQPVEERLRSQLMGVIRDCQDRVFSTYQSMLTSNIDTFQHDGSTRDELATLFKPLCQAKSARSHHRSNYSIPSLGNTPIITEANDDTTSDSIDYLSNLSAFNSSTTLSSIFNSPTTLSSVFNSSTTLSSIISSQNPGHEQLPITHEVNETIPCVFDSNNDTIAAMSMLPSNFWTTDLDETCLNQFNSDGLWEKGVASIEKL